MGESERDICPVARSDDVRRGEAERLQQSAQVRGVELQ